jgi:competence protein ComEC
MSTKTLVVLVLCFTLGVVFRSFVDLGSTFAPFIILIGGVLLLLPRLGVGVSRRSFFVSLCVIAVGSGVLRTDFAYMDPGRYVLDNAVGDTISLRGVIVDEPDERDSSVRLTVKTSDETLHETHTKILVTVPLYPQWHYGDEIVLDGVLKKPENFVSDEDGREFNYVGYLAKSGIYYQMYQPKIELAGGGAGNPIQTKLFFLKQTFLESVSQVLHEPYAALVGGLVVGAKQSLGEDLLERFRVVGLIHIVVLSGYNVTIIAESIMRSLSVFGPVIRASVGGVSIILFALMTGAGATIVRASIMALLVVVGRALGREVDILRLLAIAAFGMMIHNPLIVVFDPSFQLSFLATLGLILVPPLFEKRFMVIPEKFGLREVAVATIATQIFVLPAIVYMMGDVSIVAIVVNLLVLAVIPITMLFGFLTGVVGLLSTTVAMIPAFFAFILLYYEVAIVELFSRLPYASVHVSDVSLFFIIMWYGVYGWILWRWYTRSIKNKTR